MEDSIASWLILAVIVAVLFGGILSKESRIHPKQQSTQIHREAAPTGSDHSKD